MNQLEDYVKRILKVLVYIEDHIEDEMSMEELAKVACHSPFHFHRIFQAIVGETAHQYVKRLRLEKAAGRLRYTEQPITEIALQSNYDTPSAFTRAFKQCMGESPRNYRTLYQEVHMTIMTKKINALPMICPEKIEQISDLNLLFIRRLGNYVTSSQAAWKAMLAFIQKNRLDKSKLRYISISHDDPHITNEERLRFDACTPQEVKEDGEVSRQVIKGGKYAIFAQHGPHEQLGEYFDRIFLKWLPSSKFRFDDTRSPFCEHFHLEYIDVDESKLLTYIYLPIC
jgi:AraC family transcriptional regulator